MTKEVTPPGFHDKSFTTTLEPEKWWKFLREIRAIERKYPEQVSDSGEWFHIPYLDYWYNDDGHVRWIFKTPVGRDVQTEIENFLNSTFPDN
jgi:hypothetical protein